MSLHFQADAAEKKKEEDKLKTEKLLQDQVKSYNGNRIEVWISSDGKTTKGSEADGQENNLDFISTLEASDTFRRNYIQAVHYQIMCRRPMWHAG